MLGDQEYSPRLMRNIPKLKKALKAGIDEAKSMLSQKEKYSGQHEDLKDKIKTSQKVLDFIE